MTAVEHAPLAAEVVAACDRLWAAYTTLQRLDPADVAVVERTIGREFQTWAQARPPADVVRLSLKPADEPAPDAFTAHLRDLRTYGTPQWAAHMAAWPFATDEARRHAEWSETRCGFLDRAVRERDLPLLDPTSGRILSPSDSVMVFDRTVWSYFGDRLVLLLSAGMGSRMLGVLVPAENRFYDVGAELFTAASPQGMANVVGLLLRRVVQHADLYHRALESRAVAGPRRITLLAGKTENFAHHLWNFHTGIERLVIGGVAENVDEVRSGGTEFFGPVRELFPELAAAEHHRDQRASVWDPHPFSATDLVVPAGGYVIPRPLVDRVRRVMATRPAAAPDPASTPVGRPVVWVGLRLGDKSWADQVDEIPRFVGRLLEMHPEATVLLDGYSYPVGEDLVSERWQSVIDELGALAASVIEHTGRPDRVLSLVGNTLRESVLWAAEVDAYLTPLGTTQHKVGWLSDAPGVVYASPGYAEVPREVRLGAWESEISALPEYVFGAVASEGRRKRATDRRTNIENLLLDGVELADRVVALLADRP